MRLFLGSLTLTIGVLTANPAPAGQAQKIPEFSLEDQHQNLHHYRFPRARHSVLTLADRKGSAQIEGWVRALKARYGKKLDVDGVADVSIIPKPFHGLVRSGFKSRLSYPVMLDFGGQVVKALDHEQDKANIYIVQPDGQIVLHVAGMADATNLRRVFNALDSAFAAQLSARTADTAP
jgi:hypothetical protein